jgi:hypothetical protein
MRSSTKRQCDRALRGPRWRPAAPAPGSRRAGSQRPATPGGHAGLKLSTSMTTVRRRTGWCCHPASPCSALLHIGNGADRPVGSAELARGIARRAQGIAASGTRVHTVRLEISAPLVGSLDGNADIFPGERCRKLQTHRSCGNFQPRRGPPPAPSGSLRVACP